TRGGDRPIFAHLPSSTLVSAGLTSSGSGGAQDWSNLSRSVGFRVLDEVLDVVTDLPDVVPHRQLDVAVPLYWPPEQVFALGLVINASRGIHRRQWIHVPEDDGHRDFDVGKPSLEIIPGSIAAQLPAPNPFGKLFQDLAWLALGSPTHQPTNVGGADSRRIGQ